MNFIGKLLPSEGYKVCVLDAVPAGYTFSLSHLYQPLAGIEAMALYQTLLDETAFTCESPQTHHQLMNYLNLPLDKIYEARLKLEALGLLKTFETDYEGNRIFSYELLAPFAPAVFFQEPLLAGMLLQRLGEQKFKQLEAVVAPKQHKTEAKEVTAGFDQVFGPVQQTYEQQPGQSNQTAQKGPDVRIDAVDFDWLGQSLKQQMLPVNKILTSQNRRVIAQMAVLYDLHTLELEKALNWALTDEHGLDSNEFNAACHDLYKEKCRQQPVGKQSVQADETLNNKAPSPVEKSGSPAVKGKMGTLLHMFETMSPRQILEDFSSGNSASEQDLRMIRDVMTAQGLSAPVMNVLIHYVLLQTNMKLSKAYLEKIAGHWSRAKLATAKDAMEFAKQEQAKFNSKKSGSYNRNYSKNVKKEVVPDWIRKKKSNTEEAAPVVAGSNDQKNQKDQAEIANVLNRLIHKN